MLDAYESPPFLTLCHHGDKARIVKILGVQFYSHLSLEQLFLIGGADGRELADIFMQLTHEQQSILNQWARDIIMLTYELRLPELTPTIVTLSEFERRQLHNAGNEYDRSLWLYECKRDVFQNSVDAHRESGEPMSMFFSSFQVIPKQIFIRDHAKYDIFCDLIAFLLGCDMKHVIMQDITPHDVLGQKSIPSFYLLKISYNTPKKTLSKVVSKALTFGEIFSASTLMIYYDASLGLVNVFSENYAIRQEVALLFSEVLLERRGEDCTLDAIAYTYDHLLDLSDLDITNTSISRASIDMLNVSWRDCEVGLRVKNIDSVGMKALIDKTLGSTFLHTQPHTLSNVQLSFVMPSAYGQERIERLHFKNQYNCRVNADSFSNLHIHHNLMRRWGILPNDRFNSSL